MIFTKQLISLLCMSAALMPLHCGESEKTKTSPVTSPLLRRYSPENVSGDFRELPSNLTTAPTYYKKRNALHMWTKKHTKSKPKFAMTTPQDPLWLLRKISGGFLTEQYRNGLLPEQQELILNKQKNLTCMFGYLIQYGESYLTKSQFAHLKRMRGYVEEPVTFDTNSGSQDSSSSTPSLSSTSLQSILTAPPTLPRSDSSISLPSSQSSLSSSLLSPTHKNNQGSDQEAIEDFDFWHIPTREDGENSDSTSSIPSVVSSPSSDVSTNPLINPGYLSHSPDLPDEPRHTSLTLISSGELNGNPASSPSASSSSSSSSSSRTGSLPKPEKPSGTPLSYSWPSIQTLRAWYGNK